jgi:hypothetical protein
MLAFWSIVSGFFRMQSAIVVGRLGIVFLLFAIIKCCSLSKAGGSPHVKDPEPPRQLRGRNPSAAGSICGNGLPATRAVIVNHYRLSAFKEYSQ